MKKQTFYYSDELNDDFGNTIKTVKPLPKSYVYAGKNIFSALGTFLLYRVIVRPIVWAYVKVKFHHKFVGKKALCKDKNGCFLYKNHVMLAGDAFIPNVISVRKKNYIVTGKETNSLGAILPLLRALGNIPLGQDAAQNVAMLKCMRRRVGEGASVTIYPEAHIWPYYTGIRPFLDTSFLYAVMLKTPVYCATSCFQKKRFGKTPRVVTFIDGPFYPPTGMGRAESAKYLRDRCYETMCARAAEHSTYAAHEYRKKEILDERQSSNAAP